MESSVADLPAQNLILVFIESFNGISEKFYRNYYKIFVDVEDSYRELDCNCTRLLGFEITYIYWPTLPKFLYMS